MVHKSRLLHRARVHGALVPEGWDKNRRVRRRCFVPFTVAAVLLAACGSGGNKSDGGTQDGPDVVTGRVMSLTAERYCVSPDRGETETCVDVPDPAAVQGVDVGECVETTADLTSEGSRVEVVDEAACAAGDLGD